MNLELQKDLPTKSKTPNSTTHGAVGATLIAGKRDYGTCSGMGDEPSDDTTATIAVETTATRFKVSVRHTRSGFTCTGVNILRATGVAP